MVPLLNIYSGLTFQLVRLVIQQSTPQQGWELRMLLKGGSGKNTIKGAAGLDVIEGGKNDVLIGGAEVDIIVANDGKDNVKWFG